MAHGAWRMVHGAWSHEGRVCAWWPSSHLPGATAQPRFHLPSTFHPPSSHLLPTLKVRQHSPDSTYEGFQKAMSEDPDGATALAYRWVPEWTGLLLYQFIGEGLPSPPSCHPAACRPAPLLHSEASDNQGVAAFLPCCCCPALSGSPQLPPPSPSPLPCM